MRKGLVIAMKVLELVLYHIDYQHITFQQQISYPTLSQRGHRTKRSICVL